MRKFVVPAFAALTLAVAAQPASAEQVTVQVNYADLDLTTPVGVEALEARVAAAVKTACGVRPDVRDIKFMADWQHCVADANEKATQKVNEKVQLASL